MNAKSHPSAAMAGERKSGSPALVARPVQPVQIWAWIGVALLMAEFWFAGKWILSDQFVAVPSGPDVPPEWMRHVLDIGQVVMTLIWCFSFYWFVIRAWQRERRLTTDSLIMIGCTLASGWDALSDVGQYWFTYNSYLFNRGSMLAVMPITLSPHAPGANEAWPMFFINTLYGNFVIVAIIMCALLRFVKSRWPQIGTPALVAICFLLGGIADFIIEGLVLLPLGFWTYAGGHWAINADTYYKFPLHEAICAGSVFASLTCLRFFVDDKGQTIPERGLDKIVASPLQKSLLRIPAVLGGVIMIFIITYHLPQGFLALHSTEWPDDVKNRSYFTNHICGPQVNLACPGPAVPIARPGAPRPDYAGRFAQ